MFGQKSTYLKEKKNKAMQSMNVSPSKIGHNFSNKVVQKWTLEKKNGLLNRYSQMKKNPVDF